MRALENSGHRTRPSPAPPDQSSALYSNLNGNTMEAERINAIANHLQDMESRSVDLRRYL